MMLHRWPTSLSYWKIQYEIDFFIKRNDAKNLPTYAKKGLKNVLKMIPFGEPILYQFWVPKPSQNGSKIEPERHEMLSKMHVKNEYPFSTHFSQFWLRFGYPNFRTVGTFGSPECTSGAILAASGDFLQF